MSANVYKEDKLAAKASGMNDFIEKPLSKQDIETKLLKVLNHEFAPKEEQVIQKVVKVIQDTKVSGEELKKQAFIHLQKNFNLAISNKLYLKALESITEYVHRLEKNFENKNTVALVEDFHIIKGVCANIGLAKIANQAGELQKISEKGDFLALIEVKDEMLDALKSLLNTTVNKKE